MGEQFELNFNPVPVQPPKEDSKKEEEKKPSLEASIVMALESKKVDWNKVNYKPGIALFSVLLLDLKGSDAITTEEYNNKEKREEITLKIVEKMRCDFGFTGYFDQITEKMLEEIKSPYSFKETLKKKNKAKKKEENKIKLDAMQKASGEKEEDYE